MEIPAHVANESTARARGDRTDRGEGRWAPGLTHRIWARAMAPSLDARIVAGEDPARDALLRRRAAQLVSARSRHRLVQGLERALTPPPDRPFFSSAVSCNHRAVEVARPALERLARALGSRGRVQPRGVVLTHELLTDPCSALYRPADVDELHELARQALLALAPDSALPGTHELEERSRGRRARLEPERRSRSPL